jgi:hypothetical protein
MLKLDMRIKKRQPSLMSFFHINFGIKYSLPLPQGKTDFKMKVK